MPTYTSSVSTDCSYCPAAPVRGHYQAAASRDCRYRKLSPTCWCQFDVPRTVSSSDISAKLFLFAVTQVGPSPLAMVGSMSGGAWITVDGEASIPIESGRVTVAEIRNGWVGGETEIGRAGKLVGREASVVDAVSTANRGLIVNSISEPETGSPSILGRIFKSI